MMPRRPATVTQADVARAIRAAHAAGLKIVRIVARGDGVSIETNEAPTPPEDKPVEPKRLVVL